MNYIHKLQRDRAAYRAYNRQIEAGLQHLRAYLCSSKFHADTTVQAGDVVHRLDEILWTSQDEANEVRNLWKPGL